MFLLKWYREFKEIRAEFKSDVVCVSCESLKQQVEVLQYNNNQLLGALTHKPEVVERVIDPNLKPMLPRRMPFTQRREMLEAEDRHRAQLLRKKAEEMAPTPTVASTTLEALEDEVGVGDNAERQTAKAND